MNPNGQGRSLSYSSPEGRLLIEVTAPSRDVGRLERLAGEVRDWEWLYRASEANGVLAQLAVALRTEGLLGDCPAALAGRLSELARWATIHQEAQAAALAEVLLHLGRAGIPVILLKGRSLAERLYPRPGERLSVDIDVLVQDRLRDPAGQVLESIGYTAHADADSYDLEHFHVPYIRGGGGVSMRVELHRAVTKPGSAVTFDMNRWWKNARPASFDVGDALLAPPDEELAYVCHHAFIEGAITLRGLTDTARLISTMDDASLSAAVETARRVGVEHFLAEALQIAASIWPEDVPHADAFELPSAPRRWVLRNLLSPEIVVEAGSDTWWPFKRICYWSLLEPRQARLADLIQRAMRPPHTPGTADDSSFAERLTRLSSLTLAFGWCALPLRLFARRVRPR